MALNVTTLKPKNTGNSKSTGTTTYNDFSYEFRMEESGGGNKLYSESLSTDLGTSEDYKAISNSLTNIFNTSAGEKILNPAFGADLKRYLFEPIDETTATVLGNVIVKAIKLYEPRVTIKNVNVVARPDQNEYEINIHLVIPALKTNKDFNYTGTLTETGVSTNY
jgi:phage baseplate assembly protein W